MGPWSEYHEPAWLASLETMEKGKLDWVVKGGEKVTWGESGRDGRRERMEGGGSIGCHIYFSRDGRTGLTSCHKSFHERTGMCKSSCMAAAP